MAATIARVIAKGIGHHGMTKTETSSRLGTTGAEVQANTFSTFTTAEVNADGSGSVKVERIIGGRRCCLGRIEFASETGHAMVEFYAREEPEPCRRDGWDAADPGEAV